MLKLVNVQNPSVEFSFIVGEKYGVGRRAAPPTGMDELHWIPFVNDDSLSRSHAELTVEHHSANMRDPTYLPTLTVMDMGSKFHTFYKAANSDEFSKLNSREPWRLSVGDTVRFGRQWNEFTVTYTPLVVTSSALKDSRKAIATIKLLGGHFIPEWTSQCNFLLMDSVTLTIKAVCALLASAPIVTPHYFEALVENTRSRASVKVNVADYIPPLIEPSLAGSREPYDLLPASKKAPLLANTTFVYWTASQKQKLLPAVLAGGGKSFLIKDCDEELMGKENVVLFQIPKGHLVDSEEQLRLDAYQASNKRLVNESELSLGALYRKLDKHCNPYFNFQSKVIPQMESQTQEVVQSVIVPETQLDMDRSSHSTSRSVIEESMNLSYVGKNVSSSGVATTAKQSVLKERRGTKHAMEDEMAGSPSAKRRPANVQDHFQSSPTTSQNCLSRSNSYLRKEVLSKKTSSSKTLSAIFGGSDSDSDEDAVQDSIAVSSRSKSFETSVIEDSETEDFESADLVSTKRNDSLSAAIGHEQTLQSGSRVGTSLHGTNGLSYQALHNSRVHQPDSHHSETMSPVSRKRGRESSLLDHTDTGGPSRHKKTSKGALTSWIQPNKSPSSSLSVVKMEAEPDVSDMLRTIKIEKDSNDDDPDVIRAPTVRASLIKHDAQGRRSPQLLRPESFKNFKTFQKFALGANAKTGLHVSSSRSVLSSVKIGRLMVCYGDTSYAVDRPEAENQPETRNQPAKSQTIAPNNDDSAIATTSSMSTRRVRKQVLHDPSVPEEKRSKSSRAMVAIDKNRTGGLRAPGHLEPVDPSDGLFDF